MFSQRIFPEGVLGSIISGKVAPMTTEKEVSVEEAGEVTLKPKSRCDAEESFFMNVSNFG